MAICGEIDEVIAQSRQSVPLQRGLAFLKNVLEAREPELRNRAAQLKEGDKFEIPILGEDVFAIFQAYAPRARENGFFEAHKEFTDVQCLTQGEEIIEICPIQSLAINPAYDENGNVFFPLGNGTASPFLLQPGLVAVLFPSDAHAPTLRTNGSTGLNLKIVVKVRNALC